ncbi:predicted integral membrane protein [Microbacterium testaceum StLB037]|uniref:Predicted integral membrane protein n=1 Tax=Microbacterium testaceum (strain StLB037) TaxID=979556 RepID=E8NC20_MICTS|nr:predicted integral membrane protein [Microbacterium testaceum StLB037]
MTTEVAAFGTLRGWARLPVAARIALIYVAARVVTTIFFLLAAGMSGPTSRFGVEPALGQLALGWDAQWYWLAALSGYPSVLPLNAAGAVSENAWAFLPVYPYLSAGVGAFLGSWGAGGVAIALLSGYGASLALHALLRDRLGDAAATWAVVFFAAGPLAAMFQVGYAESLFLLLLFVALRCVQRRRWGWLYALIPVMGFTRPGILAFALFLGLYGIHRFLRRRSDPLPRREIVHIVALGVVSVVVGFAWQVIAGLVTGDAGAYLATELAWRRNWIADASGHFVPVEGFVQAAAFWFTQWGLGPWAGYIALVILVIGITLALLFARPVRRLGVEIRLWSASYLVYLLLVFFPQSSIFRLLLPVSPLWGAFAVPRSTGWRAGVLALALLGQWWWIYNMYALGNTYWQIP